MKRIFATILCAAVMISAIAVFSGCGSVDAPDVTTKIFAAEDMEKVLSEFLTANPDRTSQTKKDSIGKDGEEKTSEWLEARLKTMLGDKNVSRSSFRRSTSYGDEFESYNVVGSVYADAAKNVDAYRIVIGANYDNKYSTVTMSKYEGNYFTATNAEGAMSNGTGVATVLKLAEYFADESVRSKLTVDIDFAFYGMGCIDFYGSNTYLSNLGGATGKSKLLLAVNLEGLGGDKLFTYFDEVSTVHGNFILGAAKEAGLGAAVSEPPATKVDMAVDFDLSLPYTPYALVSDAANFYGGYNLCAFTSGSDNMFFIKDRESDKGENISSTSSDTLVGLKARNPGYSAQMAVAAETIVSSVLKEGFTEACLESKANIGAYNWLNFPLAGYIAVAVLSLVATVIIVSFVRNYEKKHRDDDPHIKRNVKVAVFGMDYEQPKEDDVFVDIKSQPDDPFSDAFDIDGNDNDDK